VDTAVPALAAENSDERVFTLWQRFILTLATWAGTLLIRALAPTLRCTMSIEEGGPEDPYFAPGIYCFWHQCVLPAAWWHRQRDIVVMTSRSFDGEYIARIIEHLGYRAVRGSSSRGGARALLEMHNHLEHGRLVAFTIDGPRGPRYVAKPGPVLLARNTGVPLSAFHIALEDPWVLNSWDALMIPKPFSRALLRVGKVIRVPADADAQTMERYHAELQAMLDRIREFAEANVSARPLTP
jgi:lysophospholipid acyltransferase (LPLAT)-like uncharacterized protein